MSVVKGKMVKMEIIHVGEYEFTKQDIIGHGAFAMVYKGRKRKNVSQSVAIKVVTKKGIQKASEILVKEIKILRELTALHHTNLVAMHDCMDSPGYVYVIMEYCNGGDLADYLQANRLLSEGTIRLFLRQLAEAMRAIHAKGIVHRDLKPQNILLTHSVAPPRTPHPAEITLKIADFGFARFLEEGNMAVTLCGSPMYMAPEVIMSLKYDAKADLWSLGTIVYQCLTGKAPFQASTPHELKAYYENSIDLQPKMPAGTSPELCSLLIGLLRRNPRERTPFEMFFNHPFLQRPRTSSINSLGGISPTPVRAAAARPAPPPAAAAVAAAAAAARAALPALSALPAMPTQRKTATTSGESWGGEDDFVLVEAPEVGGGGGGGGGCGSAECSGASSGSDVAVTAPRPRTLTIQNTPAHTINAHIQLRNGAMAPCNNGSVPRSQPILMRRSGHRTNSTNLGSISPPAAMALGTPPSRRRSASGSSPPPSLWQVSPTAASPIRRSVSLALREAGSPLREAWLRGVRPAATAAAAAALPTVPVYIPNLQEETILTEEHSKVFSQLNFVMMLGDLLSDFAMACGAPIAALLELCDETSWESMRLGLLVQSVQALASGLKLAVASYADRSLQPTVQVKNVVAMMNVKYKWVLSEALKLHKAGVQPAICDRLIYEHAMEMCQCGAINELMGDIKECERRYISAQILLHSLVQRLPMQPEHQAAIAQYRDAVQRRLEMCMNRPRRILDLESGIS